MICQSRWLTRFFLPIVLCTTLAACGAPLNDRLIGAPQSGTLTMTSALGAPPAARDAAPRAARAKASPELAKEIRSLESQSAPGNEGYRIGPQDVLEISVYQSADLTKAVQVAETGTINVPLLGDVQAGGLTARDLERSLRVKLGAKYFQNPQVTVFIKEYVSQRVIVEGYVRNPGVYPYRGPTSLMQLIASAGGLSELANASEVMVFRTVTGARQAARFDIDDIRAGRAENPPILQGDVVIVNASEANKIYQGVMKVLPLVGIFGVLL